MAFLCEGKVAWRLRDGLAANQNAYTLSFSLGRVKFPGLIMPSHLLPLLSLLAILRHGHFDI